MITKLMNAQTIEALICCLCSSAFEFGFFIGGQWVCSRCCEENDHALRREEEKENAALGNAPVQLLP